MSPRDFSILAWIAMGSAWAFLVASSLLREWVRRYRLVLVYAYTRIGMEIVLPLIIRVFGHGTMTYTYAYILMSLALTLLALAVLLSIRSVYQKFTLRGEWLLLAGVAGVGMMGVIDERPIWPLFRLLDICYTILTFVGAATCARMLRKRREVNLGWNLKMVLLALTLPASFYALVFTTYTMGMDFSYEHAAYWLQGLSLASWIILAVGMSHYSPPRRVGLPSRASEAVLDGDSSTNENGSERFAEGECHTGGASF